MRRYKLENVVTVGKVDKKNEPGKDKDINTSMTYLRVNIESINK